MARGWLRNALLSNPCRKPGNHYSQYLQDPARPAGYFSRARSLRYGRNANQIPNKGTGAVGNHSGPKTQTHSASRTTKHRLASRARGRAGESVMASTGNFLIWASDTAFATGGAYSAKRTASRISRLPIVATCWGSMPPTEYSRWHGYSSRVRPYARQAATGNARRCPTT